MITRKFQWIGAAVVVLSSTLAAYGEGNDRVLFKGQLRGEPLGDVSLTFSLYERQGGQKLLESKQVVRVRREGLFSTYIDVPFEMSKSDIIWVEFAKSSAPDVSLGNGTIVVRQGITNGAPGACALCFTCGGDFPYTGGYTAYGTVRELGYYCGGEYTITDDNPGLCCRY